jgi:hypothetical protein
MAAKTRAPESYDYVPHPHILKRKSHPAAPKPKAAGSVTTGTSIGFNAKIGLFITKSVGTMWAAYLFFALTLVSLPSALSSGNTIIIVSWVAQTFLQLVLLPIIIVGQNIQAASSDERARLTYEDAAAVLEEAIKIQAHLSNQDKQLEHLIAKIETVELRLDKASI